MPQKNKASKYTKMLIAFDTEENFDLVNDSLNAISKKHTIGKGYMAQKAGEKVKSNKNKKQKIDKKKKGEK